VGLPRCVLERKTAHRSVTLGAKAAGCDDPADRKARLRREDWTRGCVRVHQKPLTGLSVWPEQPLEELR
jgi:hypothetical protein